MISKHPIYPLRVRKVPKQFSWVDHRLVRDHYIESCTHPAATLYLFLVTVADCKGLSFYSDPSIMSCLSMDVPTLEQARQNLIHLGLIAYEKPLYQVLSIEPCMPGGVNFSTKTRHPLHEPLSVGQIFKQMMGENS